MRKFHWTKQFNWRILLIRVLVNALILGAVVTLLPKIYIAGDHKLLSLLGLAVVMGLLNALIRPLIEFLTLPFIFATYGIVVILINTAILLILDWLTKDLVIESWLWAFVAGILMGLLGSALESLLGVTPPILPERLKTEKLKAAPAAFATKELLLKKIEPKSAEFAPLPGSYPNEPETLDTPISEQPPLPEQTAQVPISGTVPDSQSPDETTTEETLK